MYNPINTLATKVFAQTFNIFFEPATRYIVQNRIFVARRVKIVHLFSWCSKENAKCGVGLVYSGLVQYSEKD